MATLGRRDHKTGKRCSRFGTRCSKTGWANTGFRFLFQKTSPVEKNKQTNKQTNHRTVGLVFGYGICLIFRNKLARKFWRDPSFGESTLEEGVKEPHSKSIGTSQHFLPRVEHNGPRKRGHIVAATLLTWSWTQKCFGKSNSETFVMSARDATLSPRLATDGQHRRTQFLCYLYTGNRAVPVSLVVELVQHAVALPSVRISGKAKAQYLTGKEIKER